ncbi:MAG: site-specific integrase [Gaiella sp.]|nr:site-specific integrase [Gaiella sp.]
MRPFPAETFSVADDANARAIELRRMRAVGIRHAPRSATPTLAEAAASLLARKRVAGKRGPLTAKGIKHWDDSTRPWREGKYAALPLDLLDRRLLEDAILARAAEHPVSARNELQALKATLRYAQARGHRFDAALLTIEPVATPEHEGRALTADELEHLAAHAPSYAFRLVLLAGTTGNRINELFTLTDDRLDLAGRTMTIPPELCKERRRKVIPLTDEETQLLRAQLLARAPGTRLVFPKRHGSQWRYSAFRKLVWLPMLRDAAEAWERERTTPEPFTGLTAHDLRHTAATLMREAGMPAELAAERLGHADEGVLLLRTYRHVRQGETRAALDAIGHGLRAASLGHHDEQTGRAGEVDGWAVR